VVRLGRCRRAGRRGAATCSFGRTSCCRENRRMENPPSVALGMLTVSGTLCAGCAACKACPAVVMLGSWRCSLCWCSWICVGLIEDMTLLRLHELSMNPPVRKEKCHLACLEVMRLRLRRSRKVCRPVVWSGRVQYWPSCLA